MITYLSVLAGVSIWAVLLAALFFLAAALVYPMTHGATLPRVVGAVAFALALLAALVTWGSPVIEFSLRLIGAAS